MILKCRTEIPFSFPCLLLSLFIFLSESPFAQTRLLDSSIHYLRIGDRPEWEEFANSDTKKDLTILFNAVSKTEKTLSLRQYDVKQNWNIFLNDQKIGSLVTDGNAMRTYYQLVPEKLKSGENKLTIQAATNIPDDIVISELTLDERSIDKVLTETTVDIEVSDLKTKKALPVRITVVDHKRVLQSTGTNPENHLAIRPGFVYTATGKASLLLPAGDYTIYAGRGFEYSVDSIRINVKTGEKLTRNLMIARQVETGGWVSSDTHIHTLSHSGHGDATDRERALTIAGEGIELPVITEHNTVPDFASVAKAMKVDEFFTPVHGDEVTTVVGHFNVFPFTVNAKIPNHQVKNWQMLSENLQESKGRAVVLNHGRDIHNGFRPFDPGKHIAVAGINLDDWKLPANAMEVINSGALLNDPMRLFNDWFGMLNRGFTLTPAGASDSHDVSRYLIGQARTYIRAADTDPGKINIEQAVKNFNQGRVMVSFGLLPKVIVNKKYGPGDLAVLSRKTIVDAEVSGPDWINAERVTLYANGIRIHEEKIENGNAPGIKWKGQWELPHQKQDVFLVVIAEGSGSDLPFWPIVKPFQPVSVSWKPYTIGSSGAIFIDADADGKYSSAYEYASKLVNRFGIDMNGLFKAMSAHDEAVAVQAAALLQEKGIDLSGASLTSSLSQASASIKEGFKKFMEGWVESKRVIK